MCTMSHLRCAKCHIKFESRDLLAMHMLEHSFSTDEVSSLANENTALPVVGSALRIRTPANISQILRNTSKYQLHSFHIEAKCELCPEVFRDQDSLAMHTLSHTKNRDMQSKPSKECFSCSYCGMVFSYEDMLLLHVMSKHKHKNNRLPLDLSIRSLTPQKRKLDEIQVFRVGQTSHTQATVPSRSQSWPVPTPSQLLAAISQSAAQVTLQSDSNSKTSKATAYNKPEMPQTNVKVKVEDLQQPTSQTEDGATPTGRKEQQSADNSHPENAGLEKTLQHPTSANLSRLLSTCQSQLGTNHKSSKSIQQQSCSTQVQSLLSNSNAGELYACTYCSIIFLDRAMYNLHAGLHNCNSPLQCNICGKKCSTALEFSAHVIHN